MTEEEMQFRLNHSSAGGRHSALAEVVRLMKEEAGRCFAEGKDNEAHAARKLAAMVDKLRESAEHELKRCIDEAELRHSYN